MDLSRKQQKYWFLEKEKEKRKETKLHLLFMYYADEEYFFAL
jgi:hypothetical protein